MACPFFDPLEPWPADSWPGPSRQPLGQPWRGVCAVSPDESGGDLNPPDELTQAQFCNFGYARGRCSRFPASSPADAHRFALKGRTGSFLAILWIAETDCAPIQHETFDIHPSEMNSPCDPGASTLTARQSRAFARACLAGRVPLPDPSDSL